MELTEERKRRAAVLTIVLASLLLFLFAWLDVMVNDENILEGLKTIATSQAILITDYFLIGGVGATFLNATLIFAFNFALVKLLRVKISGIHLASFFTVYGFSFFGKNIFNILPFYLGGILYGYYDHTEFKEVFPAISFSTALAPFVSEVAFRVDGHETSYINALLLGIILGFIVTPLSKKLFEFHRGFNLYNLGFVGGIIGAVTTSILKLYKFNVTPRSLISTQYDLSLRIICMFLFFSLILIGFYLNGNSFRGYPALLKDSGYKADFVVKYGFGATLINMGVMGFIGLAFVYIWGMTLNGPFLAAIFTLVGFSAYGESIFNTIPILIGVSLGKYGTDTSTFTIILSALFATALAPIPGVYGAHWGIVAGWLHIAVVQSIGVVHGGLNLYNNGFAAGIVAGVLHPVMEVVASHREKSRNAYLQKQKELHEVLLLIRRREEEKENEEEETREE
ncbi:MAG: DUF1576 domain-containing protein [Fusobacteriaceae bacterium]|nr:DUF1576 domain-containing protein [Fusobacteriaceae bacterium]